MYYPTKEIASGCKQTSFSSPEEKETNERLGKVRLKWLGGELNNLRTSGICSFNSTLCLLWQKQRVCNSNLYMLLCFFFFKKWIVYTGQVKHIPFVSVWGCMWYEIARHHSNWGKPITGLVIRIKHKADIPLLKKFLLRFLKPVY